MSEVVKTKNKIIVSCDCGAVHKITKNDETDELEISSTYKKQPQQPPKKEDENNGQTQEKSNSDFF